MSDSLSKLISIYNLIISQPVVCQIINELNERKNSIYLAWISVYFGIIGNEEADLKAKETTGTSIFELGMSSHISHLHFRNSIKFKNTWMDDKSSGQIATIISSKK